MIRMNFGALVATLEMYHGGPDFLGFLLYFDPLAPVIFGGHNASMVPSLEMARHETFSRHCMEARLSFLQPYLHSFLMLRYTWLRRSRLVTGWPLLRALQSVVWRHMALHSVLLDRGLSLEGARAAFAFDFPRTARASLLPSTLSPGNRQPVRHRQSRQCRYLLRCSEVTSCLSVRQDCIRSLSSTLIS